jgi:hypothetical protein
MRWRTIYQAVIDLNLTNPMWDITVTNTGPSSLSITGMYVKNQSKKFPVTFQQLVI